MKRRIPRQSKRYLCWGMLIKLYEVLTGWKMPEVQKLPARWYTLIKALLEWLEGQDRPSESRGKATPDLWPRCLSGWIMKVTDGSVWRLAGSELPEPRGASKLSPCALPVPSLCITSTKWDFAMQYVSFACFTLSDLH